MELRKRMWRKVATWALCGGLGAGGIWLATSAKGQTPVPAAVPPSVTQAAPKKIYTNRTDFRLPVKIDPKGRGNLREICLYVKAGGGTWVLTETGQPHITEFRYRAPQDGEYWFSVVTKDKNGRSSPADIDREPPGLMVVVDTAEPALDLQPFNSDNEVLLRCTMQDANPDVQSLRLVYRGADSIDHIAEALPGRPGVFRVPQDVFNRPVLVKGTDRCGNPAVREFQLRTATPPPTARPAADPPSTVVPATHKPETVSSAKPGPAPAPAVRTVDALPKPIDPIPREPITRIEPTEPTAANDSVKLLPTPPSPPAPKSASATPPGHPNPTPPSSVPGPELNSSMYGPGLKGPRQLLNTCKAALEYRIDQIGPSGVGKVEVFTTTDNGTTWQRLAEDTDKRSPAEITLPGEGVYGVRLIVTNGNGFGGAPPVKGEAPTSFIEVDTTQPFVQLRDIEPTSKDGCLEIRWKATDRNLGTEPVNLYYRIRPDAPWLPIAKKVRNEGVYLWSFPRDSGNRFHVKIEVTDQAGNVAKVECPNPVVLDMTEPRASVIGISGMIRATPQQE